MPSLASSQNSRPSLHEEAVSLVLCSWPSAVTATQAMRHRIEQKLRLRHPPGERLSPT